MYPDSGYKTTHAQSVCTRPFSRGEGPGDEASTMGALHCISLGPVNSRAKLHAAPQAQAGQPRPYCGAKVHVFKKWRRRFVKQVGSSGWQRSEAFRVTM